MNRLERRVHSSRFSIRFMWRITSHFDHCRNSAIWLSGTPENPNGSTSASEGISRRPASKLSRNEVVESFHRRERRVVEERLERDER